MSQSENCFRDGFAIAKRKPFFAKWFRDAEIPFGLEWFRDSETTLSGMGKFTILG